MPTTPNAGLRYPDLTSAPNVPLDVGNLASDLDTKIGVTVANITARDALTKWTGLVAYVTSEKRAWRWDGTAWQYAGGASPPIAALTLNAGWTNAGGFAPGVYKDASGLVHFVGGFTNNNAYVPAGPPDFLTLPAEYRPAHDWATTMEVNLAGAPTVTITVKTTGGVEVSFNDGTTIPAGTVHGLGSVPSFHPGYTGTLPYA